MSKTFFDTPTLVCFRDHGLFADGERQYYGIAYKYELICLCCGGTSTLDDRDVEIEKILDWIDLSNYLVP